jgi:hypothetical protein
MLEEEALSSDNINTPFSWKIPPILGILEGWHSSNHAEGNPMLFWPCLGGAMVLYLSLRASVSIVRGKFGIFHFFLRANP